MPLDDVHTSDSDLVAIRIDGEHFADQTAIFAADHLYAITLADVQGASLLLRQFSEHLRCQRDDPHEALFPQLAADGPEDAGAAGLAVRPQDHRCILIELDVRAVGAAMLLRGSHHNRLDDLALFDVAAGDGVLDGSDDDVANARVPATGSAEYADAQDFLGTSVVGDPEPRLLLDHLRLLRFLDDLDETPALRSADRPGLHHTYPITNGGA